MARPREPIRLIQAKGRKHLTKQEISERQRSELPAVCPQDVKPPAFLTAAQKKRFSQIAEQLSELKILGETDTDALARYVTAESLYEDAVRTLRKLSKQKPDGDSAKAYLDYLKGIDIAQRSQDRLFRQAQSAARELGLTISARCRLVVPQQNPDAQNENKFAKFLKKSDAV
jgi:P27 family predicted phage terminase small subunit